MSGNFDNFPTVRIARATSDLDAIAEFYVQALGLDVLFKFEDHEGFDGLIMGKVGSPLHLEVTTGPHGCPTRAPDPDDLLVFYLGSQDQVRKIAAQMQSHGFQPVKSSNPYWDREGVTFEDPDGFRLVLHGSLWPI